MDIASPLSGIFKYQKMETPSGLIQSLFEQIKELGLTTMELTRLKVLEAITKIVSSLVAKLIVVLVFFMFALILNVGLALYLGEILGKIYLGFFIVAAFDLIVGIVLHFFLKKWINTPVSDSIISEALQ